MSEEASTLSRLKQSFQLLLPLVDDLADALGLLLMISLAVIIWVFIYLFHLHHFYLSMSLGVSFLSLLPLFILSRFWFALENLKDIPKIAEEMIDDVRRMSHKAGMPLNLEKKGR